MQYDLPDTVRIKGAISQNKNAGFGVSIPDRFFDLSMKKKKEIPGPTKYFEETREISQEDLRSMNNSASRAVMHSVIEKNKYSSLDQSASQVSLKIGRESPTSQTKETTRFEKESTRSVTQSVNLKMYMKNIRDSDGKKFSFGLGRQHMYPLHVDKVLRQSEKFEMHAGHIYDLPRTFGKQGLATGLGRKNNYDDIRLMKNGQYPGPGAYVSPREHIRDKFSV